MVRCLYGTGIFLKKKHTQRRMLFDSVFQFIIYVNHGVTNKKKALEKVQHKHL